MRLKSQVYFSNNYLFIKKSESASMFFFLPGMALRYLEKPKRQKERGRGWEGGGGEELF